MTGDDLKRLRERRGLERDELAEAINQALGTGYSGETIARWERGRNISAKVSAFLDELAVTDLGEWAPGKTGEPVEPPPDDPGVTDTPPGPGPSAPAPQVPMLTGRSAWVKACEELWEMIATGVGMLGAATGNTALMNDGAIIAQDKEALGAAWGKLAETNETFRRMLVGMTEGGAWLQVALVTGTTFSKCYQGHAYVAAQSRAAAMAQPVQDDGRVDRDHLAEAS